MKRPDDELDRVLDEALAQIREDAPDPQSEAAATERVWRCIEQAASDDPAAAVSPRIRSCDDFQKLIPHYLRGELAAARSLLVKDHLGECVTCRRALKELRSAARGPAAPQPALGSRTAGWASTVGWRLATAAAIVLVVFGFSVKTDVLSFESGGLIRIEALDGELYRLTDGETVPLSEGDTVRLEKGDGIRTAKGSTALLALDDQSRLEMRERSQVAVKKRRHLLPGRQADGVIDLERGSVIVEASDQGSGHLFVDTEDCRVAVKGTVFSVSHGVRGSRVSVVEGEVHVKYAGAEDVLLPGGQTTTRSALRRVPVAQDVAWSKNSAEYIELLKEVQALSQDIDEALSPGLRYSTDLLDLVPANTMVFVGIPNVSDELGKAYDTLRSRMASNEILRDWWQDSVMQPGHLEQILERIRSYGDHLGQEVVLTQGQSPDGNIHDPLFLARLERSGAFKIMLEKEIAQLTVSDAAGLWMHVIEGPLPAGPPDPGHARDAEVFFWMHDGLLAVTTSFDKLRELNAVRSGIGGLALAGGAFHERLSELYRDGVEWVVGVDLERLIRVENSDDAAALEALGLLDVQHLIAERKGQDEVTLNRAVLTFDQPRRRMAAWLAPPAPIGALDYVGPDANLAAAFVMKDLRTLVDELFSFIAKTDDGFEEELARFEREQGIDVREDFAAPLGGEFALALDGPVLPTPSWKLIVEVYDPTRFRNTLEWLVEQINTLAQDDGEATRLLLEREQVGAREFFRLVSLDTTLAVHFVFDNGYLIAGPSRALLERALQNQSAGISLLDSPDFVRMLPRDAQLDFSGALYQNLAPVLGPLSQTLTNAVGDLSAENRLLLDSLSGETKASLALLYGEEDRISFLSTSEGGLFSSGLSSLSGFGGLLGMQQSLLRAVESGAHDD